MPRTTLEAVATIVDPPAGKDISGLIDTASAMVDDIPPDAYSDVKFELIERWLVAHLLTVDPSQGKGGGRLKSQRIDVAEEVYDLSPAGLMSTEYGRTACSLDSKGYLAATQNTLAKIVTDKPAGKVKKVTWLGKKDYPTEPLPPGWG